MNKTWTDEAWDAYLYWQENDKKMVKKINRLIKEIERGGVLGGLGKAEALKGNLSGKFSRRIDDTHRLLYYIKDNVLHIVSCYGHY